MMMEQDFLEKLRKEITYHLPGERAHVKMSPISRPLSSLALKHALEIRESAVAVVLYEEDKLIKCILTQRQEYEGKHSGQVSFPGGKKEVDDVDLEYTARRECYEEIGIPLDQGELIGKLTEVFIPVSSFLVQPFVYFHSAKPQLDRNLREVAEILHFTLFDLLEEDRVMTMDLNQPNGGIYKDIPYFNLVEKNVWGATALILNELKEILQAIT
jgi:8-oxo-dGTP pyrophosphatase MutT (NUDIX family)